MFRLAAVYRSELRFGPVRHSCHSCLALSDTQKSVNLQSVKNRIPNMIIRLKKLTLDSKL